MQLIHRNVTVKALIGPRFSHECTGENFESFLHLNGFREFFQYVGADYLGIKYRGAGTATRCDADLAPAPNLVLNIGSLLKTVPYFSHSLFIKT
jgi:hypothetical protein